MKKWIIATAVIVSSLGYAVTYEQDVKAQSKFTLECQRYDKAMEYLACEQAKAARDAAEAVLRIEKKLPNFNEF